MNEPSIAQKTVPDIYLGRASSGNIVLMQESINENTSTVVVEPAAVPRLIDLLQSILALTAHIPYHSVHNDRCADRRHPSWDR